MLALSEAQRRENDKYCKIKKCSKAGFIRQAIKEKMEREP